jgi:hypothetical protein
MTMTQLPEHQRRAIVKTAVALFAIAFVLFVYTLWRGVR